MLTLCRKLIFAIARMSKKASAIYMSVLSVVFLGSVAMLLVGVLLLDNPDPSAIALPLTLSGALIIALDIFLVCLTSISSNYVRKNPHKDPSKAEEKKEK